MTMPFAYVPVPVRAKPFALWIGAILAGAAFCAIAAGTPSTVKGVARVHDGDTLRVDGRAIRLRGIDAEELSEPHGAEAREVLRRIVGGSTVRCEAAGMSYKRVVATCFLADGRDVGAAMVSLGAALDCAHYSGGAYRALEPAGVRAILIQKPYC